MNGIVGSDASHLKKRGLVSQGKPAKLLFLSRLMWAEILALAHCDFLYRENADSHAKHLSLKVIVKENSYFVFPLPRQWKRRKAVMKSIRNHEEGSELSKMNLSITELFTQNHLHCCNSWELQSWATSVPVPVCGERQELCSQAGPGYGHVGPRSICIPTQASWGVSDSYPSVPSACFGVGEMASWRPYSSHEFNANTEQEFQDLVRCGGFIGRLMWSSVMCSYMSWQSLLI